MNFILTGLINWKTTVTALTSAFIMVLDSLGILNLDQAQKDAFIVVALVVVGWFAKDGDKSKN